MDNITIHDFGENGLVISAIILFKKRINQYGGQYEKYTL